MEVFTIVVNVLFFIALIALSVIDAKTMEIPDMFHVVILALAAIDIAVKYFVLHDTSQFLSRIIGLVCVSLPMLLICFIIDGAFGGGDIKLMAASGLFLGWKMTLLSTFFGILTGGIFGIVLLLTKNKERKDHFAFGPFLCLGMITSVLFGEKILTAYLSLIKF